MKSASSSSPNGNTSVPPFERITRTPHLHANATSLGLQHTETFGPTGDVKTDVIMDTCRSIWLRGALISAIEGFFFNFKNFIHSTLMSFLRREPGRKERLHDLKGNSRANHTGTNT